MSDAQVLHLIEEMEGYLRGGTSNLDPKVIAAWHARFLAAVASAEKGLSWPSIVSRAHAISAQIDQLAGLLQVQMKSIKQEMEAQSAGQRALKAYRSPQP
jgi:hypothetical protein